MLASQRMRNAAAGNRFRARDYGLVEMGARCL
jgi:hypothetical protein